MDLRTRRRAVTALGVAGVADSLHMLAYKEGLIDHLVCPLFGEGCDKVGRSPHAEHLGVPHAAIGAVDYAAMATLAAWAGREPPERRPLQPLGLGLAATSAVAASAFLVWEQKARVRAFCFWCLTSAGINATILALSARDAVRAASRSARRAGTPGRR
jgi:uncharacterized membrane protein